MYIGNAGSNRTNLERTAVKSESVISNSQEIQAVDVHGHFGVCKGGASALADKFATGDADEVVRRARLARTKLTIVSPLLALFPRFKGKVTEGNKEAALVTANNEELMQWVVVNPLQPETFDQAAEMLQAPRCAGIKIHPEEHGYPIVEHGRALFAFAAEHNAVMVTHSGEKNSMPADFVPFANDFPNTRLILAHLGFSWDGDHGRQVYAIESCRHGNIFTDTSSALSITPNLLEWAVEKITADKILYGTDTPLYFAPMQRARIDFADISKDDKRKILRDNAVAIFQLHQTF